MIALPNSLVANRFWEKVDIKGLNDCWEWLGAIDRRSGYGRASDGDVTIYAHRLSWMMAFGDIPKFIDNRKTMIRHLCGNSSCVNPRHLAIGNGGDNNNDRYEKRGLKLTLDDIKVIKELKLSNISNMEISKKFNVCAGTISRALRGKGAYSKYLRYLDYSHT